MAAEKRFLDQLGVGYLWTKFLDELKKKTPLEDFASLENRVKKIETAEYEIYGGSASDVVEGGE